MFKMRLAVSSGNEIDDRKWRIMMSKNPDPLIFEGTEKVSSET